MAHRILYYMVDGSTAKAQQILKEWGVDDQIELIGCAHEPLVDPSPAQMVGCEGFIGEFGPVSPSSNGRRHGGRGHPHRLEHVYRNQSRRCVGPCTARHHHHQLPWPYCSLDVAQHAAGLSRSTSCAASPSPNREVPAGAWEPTGGYTAHRTQGQTIGLVCFGNIARAMASIVQALGMNVVVWAPTKTREDLARSRLH